MASSGDYYINVATGTIQQQHDPLLAAGLLAAGFIGPYSSIAAAKAALPGGKDLGGDAASAAKSAENAIPGLPQIGGFFSALTDSNTWIRVAKVVIGGLLLIVGLVHITGAENTIASAARKVPLPV